MAKSIEEQIEDIAKKSLLEDKTIKYYTKTESINAEIDEALKKAPSKKGGTGTNFPDIKLFIETKKMRKIPVMIEVKGREGDLIKENEKGEVDNLTKNNEPHYTNISKYAVNGAIHYANAILDYTSSYTEVIAIGMNGYKAPDNSIKIEISAYYISKEKYKIPKKIGEYRDLSFLYAKNQDDLIEKIDNLNLTDQEIEAKTKEYENQIEVKLKSLNQKMHDDLQISAGSRVELIAGMIIAGLGVEGKVSPLEIADLKGNNAQKDNDGIVIINKISSFLEMRNLPTAKKDMLVNDLSRVFVYSDLWKAVNGESKLKTIYINVKNDIMPIFTSAKHLDFTGKLFNVLNEWIDIPDGDKNDVVLTPRYITELMARLCEVNKDSYVWDFAVGSAGFLISAMKLMVKDAEEKIKSPKEIEEKIIKIKGEQLLGIEKRADIYLLAILNMILMGDGSSNIIHKDSLKDYTGTYEIGSLKDKDFPANVFLLNPPYSSEGKGFVFVEKALSKMKSGKAAILIQENAGSGNGLPYTKEILKNNTLIASIHMPNIFLGKSTVQTAIYVFDIGTPHNEKRLVKFIDFSNDGYTRGDRKKSSQEVNLKNTDNAIERYEEIVDLVLYGRTYLKFFTENEYIEEPITLDGDDWTFFQHKKVDTKPKLEDFKKPVRDYLEWKVSNILKEDALTGKIGSPRFERLEEEFLQNGGEWREMLAGQLFEVSSNPQLNKDSFVFIESREYPYFTRTVLNNGIAGYVEYLDEQHKIKGNSIAVGMLGMQFFYMEKDFYAGQFTKTIFPKFSYFNRKIALYFISLLNKNQKIFQSVLVKNFEKTFNETKFILPYMNDNLSFSYIEKFIEEVERDYIEDLKVEHTRTLNAYLTATELKDYELTCEEKEVLERFENTKDGSTDIE